MTNKKFKLAAMSMALTACVAAQPLMANAADDVDASQNTSPAPQEESSGSSAPAASSSSSEEKKEEVKNVESKDSVSVIGGDNITVDYPHTEDTDKTTKNDDGSTTTESKGDVNKKNDSTKEETPKAPAAEETGSEKKGEEDTDKDDTKGETDPKNEETAGDTDPVKKDDESTDKGNSDTKDETDPKDGETTGDTDPVKKDDESTDKGSSDTKDETDPKDGETTGETDPEKKTEDDSKGGEADPEVKNEADAAPKNEEIPAETKPGASDSEKKDDVTTIGSASRKETETKDTETVLDPDSTRPAGDPYPSEDGTEIITPTITEGTETTTTTVEGEASSDTEDSFDTPSKDIDLDEELGGTRPKWDAAIGSTFGKEDEPEDEKYKVTDVVDSKDGKSQTITMVKEKTESGEMTGEDIAKLIEAGYQKNDDGTYTLSKTYTDSDGKTWTETVTVDRSLATKTTKTTLTLTLKKGEHEDKKDVNESTNTSDPKLENRYPNTTVVKDDKGNILWSGSVADLIKQADENGKVTYEKDGKTYTFTITENREGPSSDFDFSPNDVAKLLGDGYSYKDGKIYHTDGDKLTEVDYKQAIEKINLTIDLVISEEKKEDKETVSGKPGQTVDEAKKAAEEAAAKAALKDALKKAAKAAGITDSDAELDAALDKALADGTISISESGEWKYKATVNGVEKDFTFAYDKTTADTKQDAASDTEKDQVRKDNPGEKIDDINKNTSTGSAGVSGATITWTESGKDAYEVIKDKDFAEGLDIDLKNIPSDAKVEEVEGGKRYTYTDASGKTYELTYTEPTKEQLEEIKAKLLADGVTEENITKAIKNGEFTYVSWTITSPTEKDEKVTETITGDKENLSSKTSNVKIEGNKDGTFTITVNGKTYKNMTTSDGGKTYTSVKGKTTTTISVKKTDLTNEQIEDLLKETYGDTVKVDKDGNASYIRIVDGKETKVTINYSDAFQTDADVTVDTASSITVTDHDEDKAYQEILNEINRLKDLAKANGEELFWNEENLSEKVITIDIVKKIATAINFGSLKGQDLINFLKSQKEAADAAGDSYTGKSYQDTWNDGVGGKDYTGENKNTIGHLDLGVDSTLTTIDKKTEDCILVPSDDCATGDAKLEFVWSDSAEDLVNNTGNVKKVGLIERVTLDDEDGRGDGHYEFPRASWDNTSKWVWDRQGPRPEDWTGHWEPDYVNPVPDNAPTTSGYYRVTGTVAYGSLKDETTNKIRDFDDKDEAKRIAEEYAKSKGIDPSQITVVAVYPNQDKNSTPVYRAYLYKSNMTAYGYMTKEGNTCINKSFNYTYDGDKITGIEYIGGYDLLLDKLTQVSEDQITGEQYKSYSFIADLFTRKKDKGSSNDLTQSSHEYTHKVPGEDKTDGKGTGYFGKYDVSYEQNLVWKDSVTQESTIKGTGENIFYTFKKFFTDLINGSGSASRKEGTITATYDTESDATVDEAATTMNTVVTTHSEVEYHFTHTETKDIIEEGTIVTPNTPGEDDDDDDPVPPVKPETPPVQDATPDPEPASEPETIPDTPISPENPELPPVQDARPDTPALPSDPVLPAVQDAHALPQTGVNWLAAIGMALSGLTLMITGAFTSLTYKDKH